MSRCGFQITRFVTKSLKTCCHFYYHPPTNFIPLKFHPHEFHPPQISSPRISSPQISSLRISPHPPQISSPRISSPTDFIPSNFIPLIKLDKLISSPHISSTQDYLYKNVYLWSTFINALSLGQCTTNSYSPK